MRHALNAIIWALSLRPVVPYKQLLSMPAIVQTHLHQPASCCSSNGQQAENCIPEVTVFCYCAVMGITGIGVTSFAFHFASCDTITSRVASNFLSGYQHRTLSPQSPQICLAGMCKSNHQSYNPPRVVRGCGWLVSRLTTPKITFQHMC